MHEASLRILPHACGTRPGSVSIAADGSRVDVALSREPMTRADWKTHDYNVHFCIGLENEGSGAVEAVLSIEGGHWDDLPDISPVLYESPAPEGGWKPSARPARTDLSTRYAVRLTLDPGETVYLANHRPVSATAVLSECDALARNRAAARRTIGESVEGREIVAYVYGDPVAKGTVLVVSGVHPPEPDTLAACAIMDWLATPEADRVLDCLAVSVVPVANPDGFARGMQAANSNGINFYWDFARDRPELCPEAAALWDFACEVRPRGYLDLHGYTFQRDKSWGPYVRPGFFHTAARVRRAAEMAYRLILDEDGAAPVTGFFAFAPSTLGSMLAETFDTITLAKFHVHLKDGEPACRRQGIAAFRAVADALIAADLTSLGGRAQPGWRAPLRRTREWWAGCLRPSLGLLRRGRIREIDLRRRGLVMP